MKNYTLLISTFVFLGCGGVVNADIWLTLRPDRSEIVRDGHSIKLRFSQEFIIEDDISYD